jgi:hypothetical protein
MDADRFDTISRSLSTTSSRRGALRLLAGSLVGSLVRLGAGDAEAHNALEKCKKKSGKEKKKCIKKAKAHNATHRAPACVGSCAGKLCGDNGCGGSCGPCFRGSCQGGICLCPTGEEVCNSACIATCAQVELRDPDTCDCCTANGQECDLPDQCCSGSCVPESGIMVCQGQEGLEACTWGAQCRTGVCDAGRCTCDGETCGGDCHDPCAEGETSRNPDTCMCCRNTGIFAGGNCANCCSGTCSGSLCTGLPPDADCTFDAQCASGDCRDSGTRIFTCV